MVNFEWRITITDILILLWFGRIMTASDRASERGSAEFFARIQFRPEKKYPEARRVAERNPPFPLSALRVAIQLPF